MAQSHRRKQVDLHQLFPSVPRHMVETAADSYTRVVDDHIGYRNVFYDFIKKQLAAVPAGQIRGNRRLYLPWRSIQIGFQRA